MDWVPNFIPFFPAFLRYTFAFNFRTGTFHHVQHILRIMTSIFFLVYTIFSFAEAGEFSFAMLHDGVILMYFLMVELTLVLKQKEVTSLVNFITEPIKVDCPDVKRSKYQKYVKYLTFYGIVPPIFIIVYGIVWPLIPCFLFMSGYNQFAVDQPFIWMITSEPSSVAFTLFLLFHMVNNVSLVQGWFLILTVTVTKLSLLTEFLVEDLSKLDITSDVMCEDLLDKLTKTRRLPRCKGCIDRFFDRTGPEDDQLGLSAVLDGRRSCCRRASRDGILRDCHTRCLKHVIVQHQKIMR